MLWPLKAQLATTCNFPSSHPAGDGISYTIKLAPLRAEFHYNLYKMYILSYNSYIKIESLSYTTVNVVSGN